MSGLESLRIDTDELPGRSLFFSSGVLRCPARAGTPEVLATLYTVARLLVMILKGSEVPQGSGTGGSGYFCWFWC